MQDLFKFPHIFPQEFFKNKHYDVMGTNQLFRTSKIMLYQSINYTDDQKQYL